MKAEIYDKDKNLIELTENIILNNQIDLKYFEIITTDKKNSEILIKAKQVTPKNVKTSLLVVLEKIIS